MSASEHTMNPGQSGSSNTNSAIDPPLGTTKPPPGSIVSASLPDHRMTAADLSKNNQSNTPAAQPDASQTLHASVSPAGVNNISTIYPSTLLSPSADAMAVDLSSLHHHQQHTLVDSTNTPTSMISDTQTGALTASISPLTGVQSLAQQQLDALTSPSIAAQLQNNHANLFGQAVVNPSVVAPGLQAIQAQTPADSGNANSLSQQQQAALMAAMSAGTGVAAGGITSLQPQGITVLGNSGHTRSTSVVDAAVAMYPNGSTTASATTQGGLPVLPQATAAMDPNVAQQLTIQLQQQIQQQEQLLQASKLSQNLTIPSQPQLQNHSHTADNTNVSGVTSNQPGNTSTNASGNQSGIQSPFASSTLPATVSTVAASSNNRHQRHLSNIFPGTVPPQTQQALFADTPVSLSTAPGTLVPGTPTQFGQLPLLNNAHVPGTATAPHPHPHLNPHLGHSRHLSLDTVNLGLMNTEVALLQQQIQQQQQLQLQQSQRLTLQETIHEHPSETLANPTAQIGSSNAGQFASTSLQHKELQQQLQQLQQLQAQHKAIIPSQNSNLLMARTVPATPQNPISLNGGTAVFSNNNNNNNNGGYQQLETPTDVLTQIQPQISLQSATSATLGPHHHHHHGHHHGSASVDLGSLSSFNINQLNSMFNDQAAAVAAAAAATSLGNGVQPVNTTIPNGATASVMTHHMLMSSQVPQASIPNSVTGIGMTDTAIMEELYEDDEEEEEEENNDEDGAENHKAIQDSATAKGQTKEDIGTTDKSKHKRTPSKINNSGKVNKKRKAPYKRFRNSFIFFANERRRQWRQEHPEVNKIQNRGFIQEMSKVWNGMSVTEKAPYVKMADADKLRYQADVKKYGRLPSRHTNEDDNAEKVVTVTAAPNSTPKKTPSTTSLTKKESGVQNKLPTPVAIAPAPPSYNPGSINPAATIVSHQQRQRQQPPSFPSSKTLTVNTTDPMLSSVVPAPATAMMGLSIFPDGITSPSQTSATGSMMGAAAVQTTPSVVAAPSSAVVDISGSNLATPIDPMEADANVFSQAAYQELLKQTFGQDISPLANEFDPSCFISTAATAVDSGNSSLCLDPASLATSAANSASESQILTPKKDTLAVNSGSGTATVAAAVASSSSSSSSSSPSKNAGSISATITSKVGTKRKRSIDGQFMTSLPSTVKRFRNSFIYFVNEKRRELQQQHAGFGKHGDTSKQESSYRDFIKNMSARWREMTEEEKAPYMQMANEDKERFNQQMREYEQEHPEEIQTKGQKHKRRRSSVTAAGLNSSSQPDTAVNTAAETTPVLSATNGSCAGLNITMNGGSSYTTPLTTPLLGPNSDASALTDSNNFSSLPPVPEETVTVVAPTISEGDHK